MGWVTEEAEVYHAHPAMSSHALKALLKTPLHYHSEYVKRIRQEPTAAMKMGTFLHTAILEPKRFRESFRVPPKVDKRTKEGKEIHGAFTQSLKDGDVLVTEDEAVILHGVAESLAGHELARNLLSNGAPEVSGYFNHPYGEIPSKMRCDYRHNDNSIIVDLKFVHDASYKEFQRSVAKYRYDVQAAWYVDGLCVIESKFPNNVDFVFIAIEKTPPFAVAVYNASVQLIEAGRSRYQRALKLYQECKAQGFWPGYSGLAEPMYLPRWDDIND